MSAARIGSTWRQISSIKHKVGGVWVEHSKVYAKSEGTWFEVDLAAEQTDPPYQTWFAYADDDEGTGISLSKEGKDYVGIATGQTSKIVDISDPSVFVWSLRKVALTGEVLSQLEEGLAGLLGSSSREFMQLSDRVTEEEIKTFYQLENDINAEIELQTNTARIGSTESNISTLNIQSEGFTTQLNQITHSSSGILAQANNYTYTGSGYWVGSTWHEGAISQRIRDLKVTTGNGNAKLSEITEVFEDVGAGKFIARGGMVTDVNGNLAGYVSTNDGSTSNFDIISSKFRVGEMVNGSFDPYLKSSVDGLYVKGDIDADSLKVTTGSGLIQVSTAAGADGLACSMNNGGGQKGGVTLWSKGKVQIYNNLASTNEAALDISNTYGQASSHAIYVRSGAGNIENENYYLGIGTGGVNTSSGDFFSTSGDFIANAGYFRSPNTAIVNFTGGHPYLFSKSIGTNVSGMLITENSIECKPNYSSTLSYVGVSSNARDVKCVGTASNIERLATKPNSHTLYGLTVERERELKNTHNIVIVNAVGDGQMWVCSESGNIEQGQWLCSSSLAGHAMLQTDEETGLYEKYFTDYTVAKARETVIWENEPNDTKLIAVYYKGG